MENVTYEMVRNDPEVLDLIEVSNENLEAIGYTDHGLNHVDMVAAMQVYHEVGYRYGIMPDHTPIVVDDPGFHPRGMAHALGYIKALMQVVGAKPRGPELKALREAAT